VRPIKYGLRGKRAEVLVELAQAGLREALDLIIERYYPMVVKIASNYFAPWAEFDDIVQSGLVGLMKAVYYYAPGKSKFSTFAWRSIDSEIKSFLTYLNRKKNQILSDALSIDSFSDTDEDEEIGYAFGDQTENTSKSALIWYIMESAMEELTELEKEIFSMWYNGYSYSEISENLDVNQKKVDNTVQKIKKLLKRKFGELGDMVLEELRG
jgi:RNA polymerase sporulation-specific sigma factor